MRFRGVKSSLPAPTADHALLHDHAQDILRVAPLAEDLKGDLWQHYYDAKNTRDLAARIQSLPIPESVALALLEAKKASEPISDLADRILGALVRIDPKVLDIAEAHPKVLDHFTKAILGKGQSS